jgi:DNA-binding NtrC family response regulator
LTRKVLIVDDEKDIVHTLYRGFVLSKSGYEVATATKPSEAIEKINEKQFDLVISDINMPEMDGFQLLSYIKQTSPKTHVIIMTGYGSEKRKNEAIANGASAYIEKPFETTEVNNLVMNLLEQRRNGIVNGEVY